MTGPRRRIWIYVPDTDPDVAEIAIMGSLNDIGHPFALVKSAAERWPGFQCVEIIGGGTVCGMLRARLTLHARYPDPMAEALAMMGDSSALDGWFKSCEWGPGSSRTGLVGTW